MSNNNEILEKVRQSVGRITRKDYTDFDVAAALELDSKNRISLVVDLENTFQVELDTTEVPPEIFYSLTALTNFMASLR